MASTPAPRSRVEFQAAKITRKLLVAENDRLRTSFRKLAPELHMPRLQAKSNAYASMAEYDLHNQALEREIAILQEEGKYKRPSSSNNSRKRQQTEQPEPRETKRPQPVGETETKAKVGRGKPPKSKDPIYQFMLDVYKLEMKPPGKGTQALTEVKFHELTPQQKEARLLFLKTLLQHVQNTNLSDQQSRNMLRYRQAEKARQTKRGDEPSKTGAAANDSTQNDTESQPGWESFFLTVINAVYATEFIGPNASHIELDMSRESKICELLEKYGNINQNSSGDQPLSWFKPGQRRGYPGKDGLVFPWEDPPQNYEPKVAEQTITQPAHWPPTGNPEGEGWWVKDQEAIFTGYKCDWKNRRDEKAWAGERHDELEQRYIDFKDMMDVKLTPVRSDLCVEEAMWGCKCDLLPADLDAIRRWNPEKRQRKARDYDMRALEIDGRLDNITPRYLPKPWCQQPPRRRGGKDGKGDDSSDDDDILPELHPPPVEPSILPAEYSSIPSGQAFVASWAPVMKRLSEAARAQREEQKKKRAGNEKNVDSKTRDWREMISNLSYEKLKKIGVKDFVGQYRAEHGDEPPQRPSISGGGPLPPPSDSTGPSNGPFTGSLTIPSTGASTGASTNPDPKSPSTKTPPSTDSSKKIPRFLEDLRFMKWLIVRKGYILPPERREALAAPADYFDYSDWKHEMGLIRAQHDVLSLDLTTWPQYVKYVAEVTVGAREEINGFDTMHYDIVEKLLQSAEVLALEMRFNKLPPSTERDKALKRFLLNAEEKKAYLADMEQYRSEEEKDTGEDEQDLVQIRQQRLEKEQKEERLRQAQRQRSSQVLLLNQQKRLQQVEDKRRKDNCLQAALQSLEEQRALDEAEEKKQRDRRDRELQAEIRRHAENSQEDIEQQNANDLQSANELEKAPELRTAIARRTAVNELTTRFEDAKQVPKDMKQRQDPNTTPDSIIDDLENVKNKSKAAIAKAIGTSDSVFDNIKKPSSEFAEVFGLYQDDKKPENPSSPKKVAWDPHVEDNENKEKGEKYKNLYGSKGNTNRKPGIFDSLPLLSPSEPNVRLESLNSNPDNSFKPSQQSPGPHFTPPKRKSIDDLSDFPSPKKPKTDDDNTTSPVFDFDNDNDGLDGFTVWNTELDKIREEFGRVASNNEADSREQKCRATQFSPKMKEVARRSISSVISSSRGSSLSGPGRRYIFEST